MSGEEVYSPQTAVRSPQSAVRSPQKESSRFLLPIVDCRLPTITDIECKSVSV